MTLEAVLAVIKYAEDQNISIQVTRNSKPVPMWTAAFLNHIHAEVCQAEVEHFGVRFDNVDSGRPWRLL